MAEETELESVGEETLTIEEVLRLKEFKRIKPKTLAQWRSRGTGPAFTKSGRTIFYYRRSLNEWLKSKERVINHHEHSSQGRKVALPISVGRKALGGEHRFGRHGTKRERGENH